MICCQFIFQPGSYDEEFNTLDAAIEAHAQQLDGYIGVDRWFRSDPAQQNSVYYFESMTSVRSLAQFPDHLRAKADYAKWYDGYHIIVSEVTARYGDGRIAHVTDGR